MQFSITNVSSNKPNEKILYLKVCFLTVKFLASSHIISFFVYCSNICGIGMSHCRFRFTSWSQKILQNLFPDVFLICGSNKFFSTPTTIFEST